jgi:hypothetical protein
MNGMVSTNTLYVLAAIVVAVLALMVFVIVSKSRRLPGEFVFQASRASRGNRLFPAQVVVTRDSITLYRPRWIGKMEESIHMAHVSSIKIDTHLVFSNVYIETSGGQDPIVCYGHTRGDAAKMKEIIERFQSERFK